MNGPEHYREAERLLSDASFTSSSGRPVNRNGVLVDLAEHAALINRAQVHATLALAAATALVDETPRGDSFAEYRAWQQVAGEGGES